MNYKDKYANVYLESQGTNISKEMGLNDINNSYISNNNVFTIRRDGRIKNIELFDFKIKHCKKIKTIFYRNNKYSSLHKPKDDAHALYIFSRHGRFDKYKINDRIDRNTIDSFLSKINDIISIQVLNHKFIKIKLMKLLLIILISILVFILGIYTLLIVFYLLIWFLTGKRNEKILFTIVIYFIIHTISYTFYKLLVSYKTKLKKIIFKYTLRKSIYLVQEIENWNQIVFYPKNMKAVLADTLDYIQIFYDTSYVYELEEHF